MRNPILWAVTLICSLSYGQKLNEHDFYEMGVKAYQNGLFQKADSLFTISINKHPTLDAFFNRAAVRKKMNNIHGYCVDLETATWVHDKEAQEFYNRDCITKDSVFLDSLFLPVDIFNAKFKSIRTTYRYRHDILYVRYTMNKKVDLSYEVIDNDTFRIYKAGPDSLNMNEVVPQITKNYTSFLNGVKYPKVEKEAEIMGTVYSSFTIDKNGVIGNVRILQAPTIGFAYAVLDAFKKQGKWNPVMHKGGPVNIKLNLPTRFKLQ